MSDKLQKSLERTKFHGLLETAQFLQEQADLIRELEGIIERQSIEIVRLQDVIFKKNQALKTIGSAQYGLQGIQEDHEPDSFGYYKEAMEYYRDLSHRFQQIAAKAYRNE